MQGIRGRGQEVSGRARFSRTKFLPPAQSRSFVARPALVARLDEAAAVPLRLVVGSPGSGKTSLLVDWCTAQPHGSTAWVNADAADRDPLRFWRAAVDSVAEVVPGFAVPAIQRGHLDGTVGPDGLEDLLVACEQLDGPVQLAVDDFQMVAPAVHEHLRFLLSRAVPNLRLVIASRAEPAVGLERLRINGQLCELRDADLRLAESEVAALFAHQGIEISDEDREVVQRRTAGWAAGLQLAAIAVRDSPEPGAFVGRLAGTTKVISEYLSTELLDSQPDAVRAFLLDTCVTDELTPELALALSPETGVTLEQVEAANLLVTRLDPDGGTFRFHHLLTEMLRHRLHNGDPAREREQHHRAATYFAAHADVPRTFRHLWWSGRAIEAIEALQQLPLDELLAGHVESVGDVHLTLSDADILAAPGPAVNYCSVLATEGLMANAEQLARRVQTLVDPRLSASERVQLLATRAGARAVQGDHPKVVELCTAVIELADSVGLVDEYVELAEAVLVRILAWDSHFAAADAIVARAATRGDGLRSGELGLSVAFLRLRQGDSMTAQHVAEALLRRGGSGSALKSRVAPALRTILGSIALEQGRLGEAELHLMSVSESASPVRVPMRLLAQLGLARYFWADGHFDAADRALAVASELLDQLDGDVSLAGHVHGLEARMQIDRGQFGLAEETLMTLPSGHATTLLRFRLDRARGRRDVAADLVDRLATDSPGQELDVALARLSLALDTGDETADLVDTVLGLGEKTGAVFVIGEAGADVLDAVCQVARRRPQTPYLEHLPRSRPHAVPSERATIEFAIDALSDRERTVLRYLVTAMSYREIADELYVSVNTVKTHVKNVISKLGAESRADAIQRARDLHYL